MLKYEPLGLVDSGADAGLESPTPMKRCIFFMLNLVAARFVYVLDASVRML